MKYKRNQYSEGADICGMLIGAGFIWWAITVLWPYSWWDWWGFILLAIGLSIIVSQIAAVANRGRLRRTVKYEFESNPSASVDSISQSTGITKKDVKHQIYRICKIQYPGPSLFYMQNPVHLRTHLSYCCAYCL